MAKDLETGRIFKADLVNVTDYYGMTITATGTSLTTDPLNRNRARTVSSTNYINGTKDFSGLEDTGGTFAIKVKYTSTPNATCALSIGNNVTASDRVILIGTTSGALSCQSYEYPDLGGGNNAVTSSITPTLNKWYSLMMTFNSSGHITGFYIDNVYIGASSTYTNDFPDINGLSIGYMTWRNAITNPMTGVVADVDIWERELSEEERNQYYADIDNNYQGLFENCVLYLDMNGDAKDVTNNNNDGTVTGATLTTDRFGNANRAYSFDGTNDYIQSSSTAVFGTTSMLCFWMKSTNDTDNQAYAGVNLAGSGTNYKMLYLFPTTPAFRMGNGVTDPVFSSVYGALDGNWHFICVSDNGTQYRLFVDGVFKEAETSNNLSNTNTFMIGRLGSGFYYDGDMGEVFLFNGRIPSADEVKQLYDLTKTKYIYPFPKEISE